MDAFARGLLNWARRHGRHDLPWQPPADPYRVWVSEIMLQQTQVTTVIAYFERFMQALPSLPDLAAANEDRVLALWSGLGYYSRARNLHAAARICLERHAGELPSEFEAMADLPGIGRSTAGAILALSHGKRHAILDANVKRVLARFHALKGRPGSAPVQRRLWELAQAHTPEKRVADYTQAIMDLGATVCTPRNPHCDRCPLAGDCRAHIQGNPVEYPQRRPAPPRPLRHAWLLVCHREPDQLLLERRPDAGIWGSLWSLPMSDRDTPDCGLQGPLIRHGFSHYRLDLTPILIPAGTAPTSIMEADRSRWCGRAETAELGLPRPIRRFVDDFYAGKIQWQEPFTASN